MKFRIKNKTFRGDIEILFQSLVNKEKFSFSKYADGEYSILRNRRITNCDNWTFDPCKHEVHMKELLSSFTFNEDGYFVGISCPCCVPKGDVEWMRQTVNVPDTNLTWANIFVNSNYEFFKSNFLNEFKNHDIILVANKSANIYGLPFEIEEHIPIGNTAWFENFDLLETLPYKNYNDKLFLFCAGPLGNMLAARMWKHNKNNVYIDIGSTLNTYLLGTSNRGYLKGGNTLNKVCVWG